MPKVFLEHAGHTYYHVGERKGLCRYWFSVTKQGASRGKLVGYDQAKDQFRIDHLPADYSGQIYNGSAEWFDHCREVLKAAIDAGFNVRRICNLPQNYRP